MVGPITNRPEGGGELRSVGPGSTGMIETVRAKADAYEHLTGLPFQVRAGKKTAFDHTTDPGTVILGVQQLQELGITSQDVTDFVMLHELGHFYELSQDPTGYRSVIDEGKRSDGLGKSFFRFYNALLDIYVNRTTANRAPVYREGSGGFSQEIKDLYTTKLFPERDLTRLPKSTQYSYALLNIGMGVGSDLVLSPEVREALDTPIRHIGREYSTRDIIETFLVPAIGIRATGEWKATVSERKSVIDRTFRKRFEALIEIDKKEGRDPNQGSSSGDLEGVEASTDDLDRATQIAERIQREANKSPEERAADQRGKSVGEEAKQHLNEEEARDFTKTYQKVYPQILQVADMLKEIVKQEISHRKAQEGFYVSGQHLNIGEVVERFHAIQRNPTGARVFERDTYQKVLTEQPQHVRIWAVYDLSGSMDGDIQLVRELSMIFAGAVQTLSLGAELEQHPLRASFAAVGYNDTAFEIVPLQEGLTYGDIARSYGKLVAGGGTYEAPALQMVADQLSALDRDESVVDIIVAITDGDTAQPSESQGLVRRLEALDAKLLAFKFGRGYFVPDAKPQVGDPGTGPEAILQKPEPDSGQFGQIWGRHGYEVRKAQQVVPAVRHGLRQLLREGAT